MKLYKYHISGGLALTLSLSSCESWLEVEPNDTRTTDYFYSTPSEMEQAEMMLRLPVREMRDRKIQQ